MLIMCSILQAKFMGIMPTTTCTAIDLVLLVVKVKARELQKLKDLAKLGKHVVHT